MSNAQGDHAIHAAPAAELRTATNGQAGQDGHAPLLKPIGAAVTSAGLARRAADARVLAESLPARGVGAVAITIVDNAGIARVKTVPVTGLEHATRWGVGLSAVYGVATVDESFTSSASVGGPAGDLRLMPDPSALRVLAAQPGWAWVPADQYTQDGRQFGCCQRSFARQIGHPPGEGALAAAELPAVRGVLVGRNPGPPGLGGQDAQRGRVGHQPQVTSRPTHGRRRGERLIHGGHAVHRAQPDAPPGGMLQPGHRDRLDPGDPGVVDDSDGDRADATRRKGLSQRSRIRGPPGQAGGCDRGANRLEQRSVTILAGLTIGSGEKLGSRGGPAGVVVTHDLHSRFRAGGRGWRCALARCAGSGRAGRQSGLAPGTG